MANPCGLYRALTHGTGRHSIRRVMTIFYYDPAYPTAPQPYDGPWPHPKLPRTASMTYATCLACREAPTHVTCGLGLCSRCLIAHLTAPDGHKYPTPRYIVPGHEYMPFYVWHISKLIYLRSDQRIFIAKPRSDLRPGGHGWKWWHS